MCNGDYRLAIHPLHQHYALCGRMISHRLPWHFVQLVGWVGDRSTGALQGVAFDLVQQERGGFLLVCTSVLLSILGSLSLFELLVFC